MNTSLILLAKSIVSTGEAEAVARVLLEDGYLGMGREVHCFEEDMAAFLNVPATRVICVNSGTAALHLAVQAVTDPGDEILVQSLTYVASFQAISAAGAVPVPCEVLPATLTMDLNDAEKRMTARTKAIMPVHYAGNPGDLGALYAFANRHGLRVIEDAAHAFGCRHGNRMVGAHGDMVCFSFDGIKNITSGEGGAVVTGDPEVARRVRDARLLGVEKDSEKRFAGERSWDFDVTRQGFRYHLSNIFAAIGRVQLRRFPEEFAPRRVALAHRYRANLAHVSGVGLLDATLGPVVPHMQPILVRDNRRDGLRRRLHDSGVQTGIHYKPNHLLSYYGGGKLRLPVSERLYGQLLTLPLHPELTEDDVDCICAMIAQFIKEGIAT